MTDAELLIECKKGLGMPITGTNFDGALTQKLMIVKSFMNGAGVTTDMMADGQAVGIIVVGVTDLWNLKSGDIKFSAVFYTMLAQLAIRSTFLTMVSVPVDGATTISVSVKPTLTFNNMIASYSITLVKTSTLAEIPATITKDITRKILTITPTNNLEAATKYGIVISNVTDDSGRTLKYTVIQFTTA